MTEPVRSGGSPSIPEKILEHIDPVTDFAVSAIKKSTWTKANKKDGVGLTRTYSGAIKGGLIVGLAVGGPVTWLGVLGGMIYGAATGAKEASEL